MSGGGVSRVSIPKSVNKTIQDIKEIAQNHSDEEIYAMLKECSMDPNETAQKLLLQDTFHEVKRKRDKRKENMNNREIADSRWRTGTQGRGGRGGRGIFSPRHPSHDAGSGRNASAGKENGVNQMPESVVATASAPATVDADNKGPILVSSSATGMANGPANAGSSTQSRGYSPEEPANVGASKLAGTPQQPSPPPHVEGKSVPSSGVNVTHGKHTSSADQVASPVSVLGVYSSASDPVLVPSLDSRLPAAVGTIKREVRSQRTGVEEHPPSVHAESQPTTTQDFTKLFQTNKVVPQDATALELASMNVKAAPEIGNSFGKMPSRAQGFEKNQASESLQHPSSSSHGGNSTSRPSSNYGSRSQQPIGSQKAVGPSKEWKPKPTNQTSAPASGTTVTSEVSAITVEAGAVAGSLAKFGSSVSEESKSKLQHKLEELQLSHSPHVIIPNHLQVPESERTRLSFGFGSFDADFGVKTSHVNEPETDKSTTPLSESSQGVDEASEGPPSSNQNAPPNAQEGDYPDNPQSPVNVAENLSPVEADVPSGAVPEFDQSNKSEAALPQGASQYSIVHTTPSYNFGLMPTVLGTQFAPFDSSEPQARDMSRLPSFVVPQYDPSTSYFFRPSTDGDGRFSPFLAPGAVTKYNGNVVSPQSGQPSQESGNSLVLSTAGSTPLVTQAAGVMQSSLAVTQPTVTFFRQPSGVHLPPYHPNYMPPFSQYIPPFYGFPTFHPLLSNTAFPQQTTGNVYPPPAAAASAGVKYPYKPGTNTSNSTHVGTPTGYPQYNSSPAGYSPNPAASTGNSTGNEDLSASQFKENNVYISGQQSEGSTVWIPTPGREVSGLQPNSFYNPSPHAQHVTYAPTQAGHGAYAGMYHPAQTVAAGTPHPLLQQSQTMAGPVEMVGPPGGLYQQPQRAQMNWTSNY